MKKFLMLIVLTFVGALGWRIGSTMSSDALSMAVGILLGVMAGVPSALLMMAGGRRSEARSREYQYHEGGRQRPHPTAPHYESIPMRYAQQAQPPVVVLTGNGTPMQPQAYGQTQFSPQPMGVPGWPTTRPARQFKVVGEQEAWLEDE